MNIADFRIEPADYAADFDDLRTVRKAVFVIGQNIPESIEFDGLDPNCHHVVARDNRHQAIGTGRLSPDGKIGRMAVLENWRGKEVGKGLLFALLGKAQKLGWTEVSLNAQTGVMGFYEKFGFSKDGGVYMEAGIPHQLMRLTLEPLKKSARPAPKPREALVEIAEINTLEAATLATLQLIDKARRQICIYTPDLEPVLYGQKDVVAAFKQFAISGVGSNAMILVQDTLGVRSQPHPLLDLAQRLPSIFSFRTPVESEDLEYPSAFIINDREGYFFRQQSANYLGVWSPTLPSRNRQLYEEFDRIWQRSRPCTEFKVLSL